LQNQVAVEGVAARYKVHFTEQDSARAVACGFLLKRILVSHVAPCKFAS
jgi:hypothetical protein